MAFKMRTTKPGKGNKYYIRKANGGYSNAIKGYPTDKDCNVLSNCVGYAYGRFNEIGGYGKCKYLAPVNAENFMQYKGSCKTGSTPKVGAVMVWHGNGNLAGHVAIVEKVNSSTQVYTSESDYGGKPFFNKTRNKGSDNNWGLPTSSYKFLGFIYNPAVKDEPSEPTTNTTSTSFKKGDKIILNGYLYKDSAGNGKGAKKTNYKGTITIVNTKGKKPYHIDSLGWVASGDIKKQGSTSTTKTTTSSKPKVTYLVNKNYKGSSLVDALNQIKVNSSFSYRSKLASKNGVKLYIGSASQNTKLLNLLKKGKLIKV